MDPAQEQAMREAFTEMYRMRGAIAAADSDTEVRQLTERAEAISAAWLSGPDAADWAWLTQVTEDWPDAPERMREITDNARHDLRVGDSPYTSVEFRSLDQAGTLADPMYRAERQWRSEHLGLAAEQARVDARLHTAGTSSELAAELAAAKGAAWDAVWGDHTDPWPRERREWEETYAMDGVNRDEERDIYLSVYADERHRLENPAPEMNEAAEVAVDMAQHGARISRLLATATPAVDPSPAPSMDLPSEATSATTLGYQHPTPGEGYELG